jgi:hypothetical protein
VRPYLEKIHHNKRAGGAAQGVDPEFKPQYHKKKKKKGKSFKKVCWLRCKGTCSTLLTVLHNGTATLEKSVLTSYNVTHAPSTKTRDPTPVFTK